MNHEHRFNVSIFEEPAHNVTIFYKECECGKRLLNNENDLPMEPIIDALDKLATALRDLNKANDEFKIAADQAVVAGQSLLATIKNTYGIESGSTEAEQLAVED